MKNDQEGGPDLTMVSDSKNINNFQRSSRWKNLGTGTGTGTGTVI